MGGMNTREKNQELIKKAGGRVAVAQIFGVTGQAIGLWCTDGVPGERVLRLCRAVDFRVTPHELRPDLYPHPEDGLPADRRGVAVQVAE